jgi:hypothetical protein
MYDQGSPVEIQTLNALEPDSPVWPPCCLCYCPPNSSVTFVSLHFDTSKEKFGMFLKKLLFQFLYFIFQKLHKLESVWTAITCWPEWSGGIVLDWLWAILIQQVTGFVFWDRWW